MRTNGVRILVAEATGTFALTFIGILSITNDVVIGGAGVPPLISIAAAHGVTIAVMVAALGAVSGGHFNPAVTTGFVITGRMHPFTGLLYWAAQIVGAALAAYLLLFMAGVNVVQDGSPSVAENVGTGMAIIVEAVATFFLVLVVFGTAVDERAPKSVFPFAIGLTIMVGILAIGPITGGALNPARAFGPAIATGVFTNSWVYWVGPLIGGILGGALGNYLMVRAPSAEVAEHGGPAPSEKRR